MRKEHSYGAVVYSVQNEEIMFLLVQHQTQSMHWDFPKGGKEKEETPRQTAKREVKEETNIDIDFIDNFEVSIHYIPAKQVKKEVKFFLAKAKNTKLKVAEGEIEEAVWLNYHDAYKQLTFDNSRQVIKEAMTFIKRLYD